MIMEEITRLVFADMVTEEKGRWRPFVPILSFPGSTCYSELTICCYCSDTQFT